MPYAFESDPFRAYPVWLRRQLMRNTFVDCARTQNNQYAMHASCYGPLHTVAARRA